MDNLFPKPPQTLPPVEFDGVAFNDHEEIGNLSDNYILVYDKKYKDLCPKDGTGKVTDWLPAINQAIIDANSQRPVQLPYGDIPISNSILIGTKVRLVGLGNLFSQIKPTGAFSAVIFNGNATTGAYYSELVDLCLNGTGLGTVGAQFNYARECWIRNCTIINFQQGISAIQSWSNGILQCSISNNTDTNVLLGAQSNDFTLVDCKLDGGGNYGLRITDVSQCVSLIGCVIQRCGKQAILLDAGSVINIQGCYFEQNNLSNTPNISTIDVLGGTVTVKGMSITGCQFWEQNTISSVNLAKAQAVFIGGSSFYKLGGSYTYSIQTSTNTDRVVMSGCYKQLNNNDLGNCIVSIASGDTMRTPENIVIKRNYPNLLVDTLDNTSTSTIQIGNNGRVYTSLYLTTNGDQYLQHYNTTSQTLESVHYVQASNNTTYYLKPINMQGNILAQAVWDSGTTANRPTSPKVAQRYFDTTLGRPIWCKSTSPITWVDATGATV